MLRPSDLRPCGRCGAPIRWTTTEARKKLAINADPDPTGNTAVLRDVAGELRSRQVTARRPLLGHERLMMPHAATCTPPAQRVTSPPPVSPRPTQGPLATVYDLASYRRPR